MLLFSRQLILTGSPRKTMPWAISMTEFVNSKTSLNASLWAVNYGAPLGSVAWTSIAESQASFAATTASLLADDGYFDRLDQGAEFVTTPPQDTLSEMVYGTVGDPPPVGAVAQVTTALAVVDEMGAALAFAVDIAQHIEGVIGSPLMVLTGLFGPMGGITWIGVSPDMAAADTARAKMMTDETYLSRTAKSKGLFIPGSGNVVQTVRVA